MSSRKQDISHALQSPQTRGQLLWTAVVVLVLAWVALDQAAGPLTAQVATSDADSQASTYAVGTDTRGIRETQERLPAGEVR